MEVFHDKEGQRFYMKNSEVYAELCYSKKENGLISLDHTWVDDVYKGKGLGKILMDNLAKFARGENLKIIPICPFIKMLVQKYPEEYRDLLEDESL